MSTLQTRPRSTAFVAEPVMRRPVARPTPAVRPPAAERRRQTRDAAPKPQVTPRRRAQELWLLLILAVAACCCAIGLLYLSSYASLTQEGYRRARLLAALRTEQEKSRLYDQLKAQTNTPAFIERRARELHMIPPEQAQPVNL